LFVGYIAMATSLQYYSVTITNSITGTAPSDGFVDSRRIESYYSTVGAGVAPGSGLEATPSGLTLGFGTAKRRGNIRYSEIIRQIQLVSNCSIDPGATITNGSGIAEPTVFSFQLVANVGNLNTRDELVAGATLTGSLCIKRCIARALIADIFRQTDVFDATGSLSAGNTTATVPRFGSRINPASSFEIGPYASSLTAAEAVISVTALH
jgi:hypothetical protein